MHAVFTTLLPPLTAPYSYIQILSESLSCRPARPHSITVGKMGLLAVFMCVCVCVIFSTLTVLKKSANNNTGNHHMISILNALNFKESSEKGYSRKKYKNTTAITV